MRVRGSRQSARGFVLVSERHCSGMSPRVERAAEAQRSPKRSLLVNARGCGHLMWTERARMGARLRHSMRAGGPLLRQTWCGKAQQKSGRKVT